ncbi:hypothetical protein OHD52_21825 [Escherichia coli]|nr:hypothetical protein [Escherichia coli]
MNTAAEAIRALSLQVPGFRQKLYEGWYQLRIAGRDVSEQELHSRVCEPLNDGDVIHLVPRTEGQKTAVFFRWWPVLFWLLWDMCSAGPVLVLSSVILGWP